MKQRIIKNLNNLRKVYCYENDTSYTYEDLKIRVLQFCSTITSSKRVMFELPQSFDAYSGLIASYISGKIFCVVNSDMPEVRKRYIENQFAPDIIIGTKDSQIYKAEYVTTSSLCLYIGCKLEDFISHNELIYVLFTSGSTGMPKGVQIKTAAIENLIPWASDEFNLLETDIFGQYAPLYFDMSMFDIFATVFKGASIVPFSTFGEKLRPANLIKKHKISFINSTPQLLEILEKSRGYKYENLKSLNSIKFGGDRIFEKQVEKLLETLPDLKLILTYGPTETTVFCTYAQMNKEDYQNYSNGIMTIGKEVANCKISLKDEECGIGEIVVKGTNVADGYLNFQSNAFSKDENGVCLYSTGDYAEKIGENYYFHGRKDSQNKINGIRVDISEIEQILNDNNCSNYEIFIRNNLLLLAYASKEILETDLKNIFINNLPSYLVPTVIKKLNSFPLNFNGKNDKEKILHLLKEEQNCQQ